MPLAEANLAIHLPGLGQAQPIDFHKGMDVNFLIPLESLYFNL
jgi:hypothetical protein